MVRHGAGEGFEWPNRTLYSSQAIGALGEYRSGPRQRMARAIVANAEELARHRHHGIQRS